MNKALTMPRRSSTARIAPEGPKVSVPMESSNSNPGQPRIPFIKIDPCPAKSEKGPATSTTSSIRRRNASRACRKTDINYFHPPPGSDNNSPPTATQPSASITVKARIPRTTASARAKRPFSRASSSWNRKRRSRCPAPERFFCRFCDKQFTLLGLAQAHESGCLQGDGLSTHALQEADKQADFMSLLGMCQKDTNTVSDTRKVSDLAVPSGTHAKLLEIAEPINERKARSKRLAVASFFRTGMVPINSKRGMEKILDQNAGVCTNPAEQAVLCDKYCQLPAPTRANAQEKNKTWRTAISKKMKFKDGEHVHNYSFTRAESIKAMNEAVIGLDTRHFKLLNKMKDPKLALTRLTDREIAQATPSRVLKMKVPVTGKKFKLVLLDLHRSAEGRKLLAKCVRSST